MAELETAEIQADYITLNDLERRLAASKAKQATVQAGQLAIGNVQEFIKNMGKEWQEAKEAERLQYIDQIQSQLVAYDEFMKKHESELTPQFKEDWTKEKAQMKNALEQLKTPEEKALEQEAGQKRREHHFLEMEKNLPLKSILETIGTLQAIGENDPEAARDAAKFMDAENSSLKKAAIIVAGGEKDVTFTEVNMIANGTGAVNYEAYNAASAAEKADIEAAMRIVVGVAREEAEQRIKQGKPVSASFDGRNKFAANTNPQAEQENTEATIRRTAEALRNRPVTQAEREQEESIAHADQRQAAAYQHAAERQEARSSQPGRQPTARTAEPASPYRLDDTDKYHLKNGLEGMQAKFTKEIIENPQLVRELEDIALLRHGDARQQEEAEIRLNTVKTQEKEEIGRVGRVGSVVWNGIVGGAAGIGAKFVGEKVINYFKDTKLPPEPHIDDKTPDAVIQDYLKKKTKAEKMQNIGAILDTAANMGLQGGAIIGAIKSHNGDKMASIDRILDAVDRKAGYAIEDGIPLFVAGKQINVPEQEAPQPRVAKTASVATPEAETAVPPDEEAKKKKNKTVHNEEPVATAVPEPKEKPKELADRTMDEWQAIFAAARAAKTLEEHNKLLVNAFVVEKPKVVILKDYSDIPSKKAAVTEENATNTFDKVDADRKAIEAYMNAHRAAGEPEVKLKVVRVESEDGTKLLAIAGRDNAQAGVSGDQVEAILQAIEKQKELAAAGLAEQFLNTASVPEITVVANPSVPVASPPSPVRRVPLEENYTKESLAQGHGTTAIAAAGATFEQMENLKKLAEAHLNKDAAPWDERETLKVIELEMIGTTEKRFALTGEKEGSSGISTQKVNQLIEAENSKNNAVAKPETEKHTSPAPVSGDDDRIAKLEASLAQFQNQTTQTVETINRALEEKIGGIKDQLKENNIQMLEVIAALEKTYKQDPIIKGTGDFIPQLKTREVVGAGIAGNR